MFFCDTYPCTACVDVYVQKSNVQNQLVLTSPKNFFFTILILIIKIRSLLDTKQLFYPQKVFYNLFSFNSTKKYFFSYSLEAPSQTMFCVCDQLIRLWDGWWLFGHCEGVGEATVGILWKNYKDSMIFTIRKKFVNFVYFYRTYTSTQAMPG